MKVCRFILVVIFLEKFLMSLSSLASQPYFSPCAHARAKVGGGREGKIRLGRPARIP